MAMPVPSREGCCDFRRENGSVGAGDKNPNVLELIKAAEPPFPAGDPLNLVEKEVAPPLGIFEFEKGFVEGGKVQRGKGDKSLVIEIQVEDVCRDGVAPRQEVLTDQPQERRFSAATDARDDDDFPLEKVTGDLSLHLPPDEIAAPEETFLVLDDKFFDLLLFHADLLLISFPMHNMSSYILLQMKYMGVRSLKLAFCQG